jgi:Ca2+:H+ antiporter
MVTAHRSVVMSRNPRLLRAQQGPAISVNHDSLLAVADSASSHRPPDAEDRLGSNESGGPAESAESGESAETPRSAGSVLRAWTTWAPLVAIVALVVTWGRHLPPVVVAIVALALAAAVLSAVEHAELIAHRVGEPFGSLVLAVAVTIIEVALILTLMVAGGDGAATLARDTVFAAAMITMNGILGLSLLLGARRFGTTLFNAEGSGAALATVATLAVLTLVLPTFTTSRPGPEFSPAQLAFAAIASLVLYGTFVLTQTVRHRDFFLPVLPERDVPGRDSDAGRPEAEVEEHADPPSNRAALVSLGLLLAALVGVVGLAKVESKPIEEGVFALGLPASFVGVLIALLVLLPETLAAARAARRNRIQISINLALGSAMASIGLTIPAIAIASIWLTGPLILGLGPTQIVLLAITVVSGVLTVVPGRATRLQGAVHLVLLAAFLFLAANP